MKEKTEKEYFRELEKDWRKSLLKYSKKELVEMFPESKKNISEKIREIKREHRSQKDLIKNVLGIYEGHKDAWFGDEFIKVFLMGDLLKYERRLRNLEYFNNPYSKAKNKLNDIEIQRAREYPILEVAEAFLKVQKSGSRYKALCPFHEEKTSSFFMFPDNNRFYCFGCHEKGDVIKLTMALHGINFIDAVKMLQN